MSPTNKHACENESNTCKTCKGRNCNIKKEFQQCIQCSSRDNVDCIRNGAVNTSVICSNYLSACLTGIDSHGYTHRRCSREYTDEIIEFPNGFNVCTENKCNTDIFPPNRLQCHHCDGDEQNCDFMLSTSRKELAAQYLPCVIYSAFDKCYAYHSEGRNCLHCFVFFFSSYSKSLPFS